MRERQYELISELTVDASRLCARAVCRKPGATWWNVSTEMWYCPSCARKINSPWGRVCLSPVELAEIAADVQWWMDNANVPPLFDISDEVDE